MKSKIFGERKNGRKLKKKGVIYGQRIKRMIGAVRDFQGDEKITAPVVSAVNICFIFGIISIRNYSVFHPSGFEITVAFSYFINGHIFFVNKIDEAVILKNGRTKPIWVIFFRVSAGSVIF